MQFSVQSIDDLSSPCDCLLVFVAKNDKKKMPLKDSNLDKLVAPLIKNGDFKAESGETLLLHSPQGLATPRLLIAGVGENSFNPSNLYAFLQKISASVLKLPIKQLRIHNLSELKGVEQTIANRLLSQSLIEAKYQPDHLKSSKSKPATLNRVVINHADKKLTRPLKQALESGAAVGEGVNLARELGDLPGNVCTPSHLATTARSLARKYQHISVKVLNEKQLKELGMASLLSVAAGSEQPAKLIVLEYKRAAKSQAPITLVGKGVTFDSGGISLKPGAAMDEMKYDMCGAASVLGAFKSVALMNLPINMVGIIPAVENMPSGKATKPGDIVKSMSGQTIEVLNTDAEGRLILCDALTYAERFKPKVIIDIATLTGACIIALGNFTSGLFSNNDDLAKALLEAGHNAADRAWQLPIWEEYDKQLKSNFADIANIGGKAGSITAACFLSRFTKKQTWAHLDIAGTAWLSSPQKGATGRPVPLLVEYLQNLAV